MQEGAARVRALITGIVPADELEQAHRSSALAWLDGTRDIYRRAKPGDEADFSVAGDQPVFITVTRTAGLDPGHTDVSLWYVISGSPRLSITLDPAEFNSCGGPRRRSSRPARRSLIRISAASSANCAQ